jgi:hypothetical protein
MLSQTYLFDRSYRCQCKATAKILTGDRFESHQKSCHCFLLNDTALSLRVLIAGIQMLATRCVALEEDPSTHQVIHSVYICPMDPSSSTLFLNARNLFAATPPHAADE